MKHRETDSDGSFEASGVGFDYRYDAFAKLLRVLRNKDIPNKDAILQVDLQGSLSASPVTYLYFLEKITQIKALAFSNYATVNLKETLDDGKWQGILGSSTRLARHATELINGNFADFTTAFKDLYEFEVFDLDKIHMKEGRDYYRAILTTRLHNEVLVRASSLHGTLYHLAEKMVSDLIALEFSTRREAEAYKLLQASSAIGMIGRILDEDFVPTNKIGIIPNKGEQIKI